jgi:DNA-binding response OmpR family regulator
MRIVVIEDNKADFFLVEEAIAAEGIDAEMEWIMDGEEAVRLINGFALQLDGPSCPDVFVLDLNLPKRSGVEILALIRTRFASSRVPVLIMTSSDSERDRSQAKSLDADGYFRKPCTYDEFMKIGPMIHRLLDHV